MVMDLWVVIKPWEWMRLGYLQDIHMGDLEGSCMSVGVRRELMMETVL